MKLTDNDSIFLTGATGFIGSHVAEYLSGQGFHLVCGVRENSNTDFLKTLPVELKNADVTNPDSLIQAMKGCSVVIHTAGKVSDWGKFQDFYNVNVVGTRNVLNACIANGIKQVISTGSVSCFGEEHCLTLKDEQSPHNPRYAYFLESVWPSGMNFYRISKSMATKETEEFAFRNNMNITVLHPVWVYGEREFSSGFYEYMQFVKSGMPFGPGSRSNLFHLIYARDLARAYHLALKNSPSGFSDYIIGNKTVDKLEDIFTLVCREMGQRKPMNLPKFICWPVGFSAELFASFLKLKRPPFLTRARVNMFYDSICYSTQKAENELSFTCRYSLEEGIRNTVQWYKDNRLI